ncbi:MAG: prolyl oligopeptidase family serine peptidase [Bacteroidota bacterium]
MRSFYFLFLALCLHFSALAQNKIPLTHEVYDDWKAIKKPQISSDGKWVMYAITPQEGDAVLEVYNTTNDTYRQFERGEEATFSYDSQAVIFKIKPQKDSVKALRREKVKKDSLPKDSIGIYLLNTQSLSKAAQVKSFKTPKKSGGWVAYLLAPQGKVTPKDTTLTPKKEGKKSGTKLILHNLKTTQQDTFLFVKEYAFTENGDFLAFTNTGAFKEDSAGIFVYDLKKGKRITLDQSGGEYKNLTWHEKENKLAFLHNPDTSANREKALIHFFGIYHWEAGKGQPEKLADQDSDFLPQDWYISPHSPFRFSKDGTQLFFETAPKPLLPDTTLLKEEVIQVEVWTYQDDFLYTQQEVNAEKDKKKGYFAVADLNSRKVLQLHKQEITTLQFAEEGSSQFALGVADSPYRPLVSWEGFPPYHDFYIINLKNGNAKRAGEKIKGYINFSPNGKYAYWYSVQDTAWFTYSVEEGKTYNLTKNLGVGFYNEFHDYPDYPWAYGMAGWTKNDEEILIYDRYDVWAFDPTMRTPPQRITQNGREKQWQYRYLRTDTEEKFLKKNQAWLFRVFKEKDKSAAYASLRFGRNRTPVLLWEGSYRLSIPTKARNAEKYIFTRQSFKAYPDVYLAKADFSRPKQISDANPQQKNYLWGSVELTAWQAYDSTQIEGMIYKPENFDERKSYPLMVYFYERNSQNLHRHYAPAPIRSIINFSYFTSNGYVVFVPDVHYKVGYPGESAYNCVISGVEHMIDKGYVDADRVGVQGHSWGGYQIAYLVTRTNIFKCAEAGAPVSNMTSAYGGIRWRTGLSRMFQYEHSQSRIGGTLWNNRARYVENSPLFFVDKIETPLLILHNDEDGAVPWYQGIEFFVAMRRLKKPVWLLNYNGEKHGLQQRQNKTDFAIRLYQFFDYYLKDTPAPKWMSEGIPATEKGVNTGLGFE